ncbi:MAG: glycine betaine ABC transporter substrate-binding protein, partial [Actinomycetota bacterium]
MSRRRPSAIVRLLGPAAALAVALTVAGCGGDDGEELTVDPRDERVITVAPFSFTEGIVLAEIYAQAMEVGGYPVERAPDLGAREIIEPALEQGVVDFVVEYTGAALEFVVLGGGAATADPAINARSLRSEMADRGITVLHRAAAENNNALVVRQDMADREGLETVSDLVPLAGDLRLGGPPECPDRPVCIPGYRRVYELEFGEFVALDAGGPRTVAALEAGEIDVAVLFTTNGGLADRRFVVLDDDLGLQPADAVVPVVRTAVLDYHGEGLRRLIDRVTREIHTADLIQLNRRVDIEGESPAAVARRFLEQNELLPAAAASA